MTFFIVISICLMLLVSLLIAPIIICIDTTSNQYYLQFRELLKVSLEEHDTEFLRIRLKILFMKFYIYPFKKGIIKTPSPIYRKHIVKSEKQISFNRIYNILRTFKIKHLFMNIDTGNYILNAQLYPLLEFLNYKYLAC